MVLFPDSTVSYMTTFVKKEWMVGNEFYPTSELENKEHILYGKKASHFDFLKKVPIVQKGEKISV